MGSCQLMRRNRPFLSCLCNFMYHSSPKRKYINIFIRQFDIPNSYGANSYAETFNLMMCTLFCFLWRQLIEEHVYWIFFKSIVSFNSWLTSSCLRLRCVHVIAGLMLNTALSGLAWRQLVHICVHIFNMGRNNRIDRFCFGYVHTQSE